MEKITNKELTDRGICPTCYDREHNHIVYGDNKNQMLYEDKEIECFLCNNPRARGHTIISTKKHYKDMLELPDELCKNIYTFVKKVMSVLKEVYQAESIYLCTMCDGPMNHFHVQLIPRYKEEKRGSKNFVKPRKEYIEEPEKIKEIRKSLDWNKINIKDLIVVEKINIDQYIKFREQVKETMNNPEWLGDFTREDIELLLQENSKIWVYYSKEIPICSMMIIPATKKSLIKFELNYKVQEVIDYGPMFVNPNYIGNNLQYQMLRELDEISRKKGYRYAVVTVHPDNIYSIRNLEKDKFKLINTKNFERGTRNIYLKEL
ncbi:MAG: HIT family protein [Bacilli bacterium]|nr:HIT family protein [Bacilli bacterium]